MLNAIKYLKKAAEDYRSMTTPDNQVTTPQAAIRNAKLADEFELAAEALRKLHNGVFAEGWLEGFKAIAESCRKNREKRAKKKEQRKPPNVKVSGRPHLDTIKES